MKAPRFQLQKLRSKQGGGARSFGNALLGRLAALPLKLLVATWQIRFEGDDPFVAGEATGRPVILAAWHRTLFSAIGVMRGRGLVIPVSRSRDGDRIAAVLHYTGFGPSVRGSSSKGAGTLLRSLIRIVQQGRPVGILPDGPRGPAGKVKPGVVALARATGAKIYPVHFRASRYWEFSSWDRTVLPRPFARVTCCYGPPLEVPREAGAAELEAARLELEAAMGHCFGD